MWRWVCAYCGIVLSVLVINNVEPIFGFSTGAGTQACSTLTPWHGANSPQSTPVPYVITVSKTTYSPLEQIKVTVKACPGHSFKGFLLQPRLAQFASQDIKIGVFGRYQNAPYNYACPDTRLGTRGQALTHINGSNKAELEFVWQAPRVPQGHVVFRATVVKEYTTYWVGINSPIVYDRYSRTQLSQQQVLGLTNILAPACNTAPKPSTTTTTTSTTTTSTTTTTTPVPTTTTPKPTTTTPKPTTTTTLPPTTTTTSTTTTTPSTTTSTTTTTVKPTTTSTTTTPSTTTSTTTTTTQPLTTDPVPTEPPIVVPQGPYIPPDPECNRTKGCYSDCNTTQCMFLISWTDQGEYVDMEIKAHLNIPGDRWIAVGFSYDQHMGSDSVTECISDKGKVNVFQSYNLDTHANSRLRNPKLGLSREEGSYVDGIFQCKFRRLKIVPSESRIFDLNRDWYFLFAHGTAMSDLFGGGAGMKLPHVYNPAPPISPQRIDLQAYLGNIPTTPTTTTTTTTSTTTTPTTTTSTTTTPRITTFVPTTTTIKNSIWTPRPSPFVPLPFSRITTDAPTTLQPTTTTTTTTTSTTTTTGGVTGNEVTGASQEYALYKDHACGKTKGCYYKCTRGECEFIVTWHDIGNAINFEIKKKFAPGDQTDRWVAVGFSKDKNMGDDSVTECVSNSGMIDVYQSYNTLDKLNDRLPNSKLGLGNIGGSYVNGVFTCHFTRKKKLPDEKKFFDLDQDFYILFAHGVAQNSVKQGHDLQNLPLVSSEMVDLQKHIVIHGRATYFLVKVHACMMILAWVCFASIGIVSVRYYKAIWPHQTCMRERIWYQAHKFCMILLFSSVMIGFVLIFVDVKGYSKIDGKTFHQAHPIMGILVVLLTVANPIIAIFRPLPGTIKRKICNWIHWGIGTGAHFLAIVTIFAGVELAKANAPPFIKYILIAYVCYQLLLFLFLEIHSFLSKRAEGKKDHSYSYEMHRKPYYASVGRTVEMEPPYSRVKKAVFGIHVLIISAFTLVLTVSLILSD